MVKPTTDLTKKKKKKIGVPIRALPETHTVPSVLLTRFLRYLGYQC